LDHDWLRGDEGHPARRISELLEEQLTRKRNRSPTECGQPAERSDGAYDKITDREKPLFPSTRASGRRSKGHGLVMAVHSVTIPLSSDLFR
jgi:hypothetical protein